MFLSITFLILDLVKSIFLANITNTNHLKLSCLKTPLIYDVEIIFENNLPKKMARKRSSLNQRKNQTNQSDLKFKQKKLGNLKIYPSPELLEQKETMRI